MPLFHSCQRLQALHQTDATIQESVAQAGQDAVTSTFLFLASTGQGLDDVALLSAQFLSAKA